MIDLANYLGVDLITLIYWGAGFLIGLSVFAGISLINEDWSDYE